MEIAFKSGETMSKETLNGKDIGNEHYSMKGGHKERSDYWKQVRKEQADEKNQTKKTKS